MLHMINFPFDQVFEIIPIYNTFIFNSMNCKDRDKPNKKS